MGYHRKEINLVPSKYTSYLKGAIDGDGHLTDRCIILEVTSKPFADKFIEYMETATGHKCGIALKKYPSGLIAYRVTFYSVIAVDFFKNYLPTEYVDEYLAGAFDSEGSVYVNKWRKNIRFRNSNLSLIKQWQKMLKNMGIIANIYSDKLNRKEYYHLHLSAKGENILRFSKLIPIVDGNKKERLLKITRGG